MGMFYLGTSKHKMTDVSIIKIYRCHYMFSILVLHDFKPPERLISIPRFVSKHN